MKATKTKTDRLTIIPYGGCGEFGMNLTFYVTDRSTILVDCGSKFPPPHRLGIDRVIPNLNRLFSQIAPPSAYVITHGHDDHIGALTYVHAKWPAPIYASAWTAKLIERRFANNGGVPPITLVKGGDTTILGEFRCEWLQVNHSIPMAYALVVTCGRHRVFHSGDFKFDSANPYEAPLSTELLREHGDRGIDAALIDSTNAVTPGLSGSETSVVSALSALFQGAKGRIFASTFSSNLWRLNIFMDLAREAGRRVLILSRGMKDTVEYGGEFNMVPGHWKGTLLSEDQARKISPRELCVVVAGCQGEHRSGLARIARGEHPYLKAGEGDVVIFSSRTIPGNERPVIDLCNLFIRSGATIATPKTHPGIHVSGHGHRDDIAQLLAGLRPRNVVAIHGTYEHLYANLTIADSKTTVSVSAPDSGEVLVLEDGNLVRTPMTSLSPIIPETSMVDSESGLEISGERARERFYIGTNGLVVISAAFSRRRGAWAQPPQITLAGVALPRTFASAASFENEIATVALSACRTSAGKDDGPAEATESVRLAVRRWIQDHTKRKPAVVTHLTFL